MLHRSTLRERRRRCIATPAQCTAAPSGSSVASMHLVRPPWRCTAWPCRIRTRLRCPSARSCLPRPALTFKLREPCSLLLYVMAGTRPRSPAASSLGLRPALALQLAANLMVIMAETRPSCPCVRPSLSCLRSLHSSCLCSWHPQFWVNSFTLCVC